ncbi:MAG: hypothetical protein WC415_00740 [Patescibacteria group bacterium]|jgi:hypothetical protein
MEELKNFSVKWSRALKIAAIVLGVLILLAIFVNLIAKPVISQFNKAGFGVGMDHEDGYSGMMNASPVASPKITSDISLSTRNFASSEMAIDNSNYGNYEVTQYNATVETGKLKDDCANITELKGRDYIIFENSNTADRYCSFSFKVDKDKVEEVLKIVKDLKPRDLNQNVDSIKKEIEDFTSREEILKNKQTSIDETLKNAISAYDEITALATKTNNADSLAKVIDSKINILERLTAQRLQVSAELESLARSKAEQLDHLKYVNFYVYIYENKIFDGQNIKDSWIASAKQFVVDINKTIKDLSLGLVALLLEIFKYLIYIFLVFFAIKFCWKLGKSMWKK